MGEGSGGRRQSPTLGRVMGNGGVGCQLALASTACTVAQGCEGVCVATPVLPSPIHPQVLEKEDCKALKMGLYLGVAEASALPPKFIHLTYTGAGVEKGGGGKAAGDSGEEHDGGQYCLHEGNFMTVSHY